MNKEEKYLLGEQVKELNEVLNRYLETNPFDVKIVIKLASATRYVGQVLKTYDHVRELKRLNLTDQFIKQFDYRDIQEKFDIQTKEAKRKVREFDFSEYEKEILINGFKGSIKSFLNRYNQQSNTEVGV